MRKFLFSKFILAFATTGFQKTKTTYYEDGNGASEKEGILDIKIHLNNNQKINLEMQNRYQDDWSERSIFYNCRMFTE